MREQDHAEVLAAIYRCLKALASRFGDQMQGPESKDFRRDMQEIRDAVEGMGGGVE